MTGAGPSSPTVSERLADWATSQTLDGVPDEVIVYAKRLILDSLGLQVRGSTLAHVQPQRKVVEAACAKPEATIIGTGIRTTIGNAAYVNGTFGASMEFDDCHTLPWHAGSVIVPAALAVTEQTRGSGADLLLGTIVGQQILCLIGTVASSGLLKEGWQASRAMGAFGAAASAAAIRGLDREVLVNAFGIAGGDASGPLEYDEAGGEVKRQYTGVAARAGLDAVQLALHGLTGPRTIFEGPKGLFRLMAHQQDLAPLDAGWNKWHLLDTFFRLNPGVATVLPALDVIADTLDQERIDWREIDSIRVGMPAFAVSHGGSIVVPTDTLSAHFSLAFALALRLVSGTSAPQDYLNPALWSDPDIQSVARKVQPHPHDFGPDAPILAADVTITMTDGRTFGREQLGYVGHTLHPATDEQMEAKFRANVDGILDGAEAETLIATIRDLDKLRDVGPLVRGLSAVASERS